jgi:hypothetical protein
MRARARLATVVLLLSLLGPAGAAQTLPGHETQGTDQLSEELYAATEARKKARRPFEDWRKTAYIVLAAIDRELILVRNPPHGSRQIKHSLKPGKKRNKWSLEIWEGNELILTCGWSGNKAVGIFVVPIQRRQVWECGEKDLDESFFRVAKEDPLWADVVDPQAVQ